jgi:RNA-directed DNA polymerase
MPQKSRQLELAFEGGGEAPRLERSAETTSATHGTERPGASGLMEAVCERRNLQAALRRVKSNKGSPGIDGMTVEELPAYLRANWPAIREQLLAGRYQPSAVRRVKIPKRGGGERELGIPTVLDRFIQQAVLQVLQPRIDASFSEHSYGFRPNRNAHGAIRRAHRYVTEGRRWVVDIDLEKFFDRVHHDVLMGRVAKRVADSRVLGLIRRYLEAGVLANGVITERDQGTPQGGPLSPLLANILLDEVDRELQTRGHAFVRYADDLNVYVRSKRAGERVMESMKKLYARLHLRINEAKSTVARVEERKFLGFSFATRKRDGAVISVVAPEALRALKDRVRFLTRRTIGRSMERVCQELRTYLRGWLSYFQIAKRSKLDKVDKWIRHRLRAIQLKQWKRFAVVFREMTRRGVGEEQALAIARNVRRWWHCSGPLLHHALPNSHFDRLGVPRLAE